MSADRPSRVQGAAGYTAGYYDVGAIWHRRADDILRVERLTSWCRKHIEPPPATILYDATAAIERLKQEGRDAE
jgi:hypothetical protein